MNLFKREFIINWKYSYLSMISFVFILLFVVLTDNLFLKISDYPDLLSSTSSLFMGGQAIILVSSILYVKNDNKSLYLMINESKKKVLLSKLAFLFSSVTIQFLFSVIIYFILKYYLISNGIHSGIISYNLNIFMDSFNLVLLYFYLMFAALYLYTLNLRVTILKDNYRFIGKIRSLLLSFSFIVIVFGVHKLLQVVMGEYYDFSYSLVLFIPVMLYLNYDSLKRGEL